VSYCCGWRHPHQQLGVDASSVAVTQSTDNQLLLISDREKFCNKDLYLADVGGGWLTWAVSLPSQPDSRLIMNLVYLLEYRFGNGDACEWGKTTLITFIV